MKDDEQKMTSRARVLTAIAHEEPDRVPIDYWAVSQVTTRLIEHYGLEDEEALLRHLGVDMRYVMGPSFAGQQFRVREDGVIEDHWGVLRKVITVEGSDRTGRPWSWSYKHVHTSPLEKANSTREIEEYAGWPSADQWDYSGVKAECLAAQAKGCAVVNGGDRLDRTAQLKPATYLRGFDRFLIDLVREPKLAECLLEHIVEYYLAYNERVFAAAEGTIDIFFMGDDMGMQTGLLLSPRHYRKYFKENLRRFVDLAHGYGIKTMYHTCGDVRRLIPDFIDCGVDILQSLQPAAMDLTELKREYGAHLAFQGGLDIQHTLPKGTPEQVAQEVRQRAETLGRGGGYIFGTAHNLLPDVPTENIVALFEAYAEFGRYA